MINDDHQKTDAGFLKRWPDFAAPLVNLPAH
jgi:hypothetical protein